jgi:hypothetical protein
MYNALIRKVIVGGSGIIRGELLQYFKEYVISNISLYSLEQSTPHIIYYMHS